MNQALRLHMGFEEQLVPFHGMQEPVNRVEGDRRGPHLHLLHIEGEIVVNEVLQQGIRRCLIRKL